MTPMTWHFSKASPARHKRGPLAAAVTLTLALVSGAALAQATGGTPATTDSGASGRSGSTGTASSGTAGSSTSSLVASDRSFMTKAAGSGLFEVEVGRLAADKASDANVKRFASMLVDQHTTANQELMSLASSKGVTLPTSMPASKRRILDRLAKQSGAEFDKEFVQAVGIKDHQEDIRLFQTASRDAKDPELKAWATKTLPVLQQHLADARKLPMGSDSSASSSRSGSGNGAGSWSGAGTASGTAGTGGGSGSGAGTAGSGGSGSATR